MEFIGEYWWLWLIITILFGGYVVINQLKRMKGMMNKGLSGEMQGTLESLFSGLAFVILAGAISMGSGVLLFLSIIINLIEYSSR